MSIDLRSRTQEINAEYWSARESLTERVAVAQLCLALARAELTISTHEAGAAESPAAPNAEQSPSPAKGMESSSEWQHTPS